MKYIEKEDMKDVGNVKRVLEWLSMDIEFIKEYHDDPIAALERIGSPLKPEDIEFLPQEGELLGKMQARHPGTVAEKYADFVNKKLDGREQMKLDCAPTNESMNKWRERQIGRCNMELGARVVGLIQSAFTLEMADGCSVGCEFCGLNAGRLKSVYKYTDENSKLFRDVLNYMKETLGELAAGQATMYFASEPLDNPDYGKFLADFIDIYGKIPQITTAAAMRHKDMLHKLLTQLNENGGTIYRFSVLSLDMFKQIVEEFTPEELTLVELLPQFEGAPNNHFAKVGREADKVEEYDNTISCLSGFVVNMARKEVRLTTPTGASPEHPTGEIILYKGNFTDIESFEEVITHCIKTYMSNILGPKERVRLREGIRLEYKDGKRVITSGKGLDYELAVSASDNVDICGILFNILSNGYNTRREIAKKVHEGVNGVIRPEMLFHIINKFWKMGILETESGAI